MFHFKAVIVTYEVVIIIINIIYLLYFICVKLKLHAASHFFLITHANYEPSNIKTSVLGSLFIVLIVTWVIKIRFLVYLKLCNL